MSQNEKAIIASEQSVGSFRVAHLELNAPKKLNAVDSSMLAEIGRRLKMWEADPEVALIVLRSTLTKAFCAGGDVKGLVQQMNVGDPETVAREFFTTEYSVDHLIHKLQKPTLCFADGITMGGGIGLMNGCKVRVVTETTMMAMPEVSIGLFPDVGASYFLPRLRENIGWLMGLTGLRIGAHEAIHYGLADYMVTSSVARKLWVDLMRLPWTGDPDQDLDLLQIFMAEISKSMTLQSTPLMQALEIIKPRLEILSGADFETADQLLTEILASSAVFKEARGFYESGSPLTKRLTHELLKRGKNLDVFQCFCQEWSLAVNLSIAGDFREGVRALLIDKDRNPKWSPAVSDGELMNFFNDPKPHDLKDM